MSGADPSGAWRGWSMRGWARAVCEAVMAHLERRDHLFAAMPAGELGFVAVACRRGDPTDATPPASAVGD